MVFLRSWCYKKDEYSVFGLKYDYLLDFNWMFFKSSYSLFSRSQFLCLSVIVCLPLLEPHLCSVITSQVHLYSSLPLIYSLLVSPPSSLPHHYPGWTVWIPTFLTPTLTQNLILTLLNLLGQWSTFRKTQSLPRQSAVTRF